MSKLVIAEKPMLARDIARAITGKAPAFPSRETATRSVPAPATFWNW